MTTIPITDDWHRGDWMQTFTGRAFYPLDPAVPDIDPMDIAHSLAMQCRYNGHVRRFYSVAEHCVLMSDWVLANLGHIDDLGDDVRRLALWALLHDAPEAYVGDMVRPLKVNMPDFCDADDRVMLAVAARFGLKGKARDLGDGTDGLTLPASIKLVDMRILLDERAALMSTPPRDWALGDVEPLGVTIRGWDPAIAKWEYIARLRDLGVDV